jgi:uncharacterized protein (DUF2267 family)
MAASRTAASRTSAAPGPRLADATGDSPEVHGDLNAHDLPKGIRRGAPATAIEALARGSTRVSMALDYASFIAVVQEEAGGVSYENAQRATVARLETLGERISDGQARDIAQQLPAPLRTVIVDGRAPEAFDVGAFLRRVAEREGVSKDLAREHARAVFTALGRPVDGKEIDDMRAQLPPGSAHLVAAARSGEVDDVAAWAPSELHEPLARGKTKSEGAAKPLSLGGLVREVADLEGTGEQTACRHARAAFAVLREILGATEYGDVYAQLPDNFAVLPGARA